MNLEYKPYTLEFKFDAGTSRGVMKTRKIWILELSRQGSSIVGKGEVAPLWRLSLENEGEVEEQLKASAASLRSTDVPTSEEHAFEVAAKHSGGIASIRFGLEMALLDLINGGDQTWFKTAFTDKKASIPINGLIWMNEPDHMKSQIDQKIKEGFDCIKMKIGAIDFEKEIEVISYLRNKAPSITIRVDANGAFKNSEAIARLKKLSDYQIHSIEQPILPRQPEAMALLCQKSPIPVALDEELIGISRRVEKRELLEDLDPGFIVLKPSLLGGFQQTAEWIELAQNRDIGWWITSALESNLGLAAIAQFTSRYETSIPQGLGTGSLFSNNLPERTEIKDGRIFQI